MHSWERVKAYIERHSLPYRVERWNMSLRGVLVDAYTGKAVAFTVRDAMKVLRGNG